jgi:hypothetical protein
VPGGRSNRQTELAIFAKLKKNAPPESLSKTRVFEKAEPNGKVSAESGLNPSQNSFLISVSQKVSCWLSFERVHADQKDKDRSRGLAGQSTTPHCEKGRASTFNAPVAGHTTSKPMLIGYACVSTIDQNLACSGTPWPARAQSGALIAKGRSYRLIGREVGLSKNTVADIVKRHRAKATQIA